MPTMATGHKQLNLTFPAHLIDAAKAACDGRGVSLTAAIERHLHKLAGLPVPKPRKRGRPASKNIS